MTAAIDPATMDSAGGVDFSLTVPRCPRPLVLSSPVSAGKDPARAQSEPAATQLSLQMKGRSSSTAITGNWKKRKRKSSSPAAAPARSDRTPFCIQEAHEVDPGDEVYWTTPENKDNLAEEKRPRWVHNTMIKDQLQRGGMCSTDPAARRCFHECTAATPACSNPSRLHLTSSWAI